ncbi:hypothetical protein Q604_UNBC18358G0003 [human gut metagenome]|uniref:Uncharacterized protein n=1 Tax=human gut metagenome TaxID=408170 RepID=W1WS81_9ZZZZ|nr:hypothetical protein [Clostridium butyricum]MDU5821217.1 hypothetical protein [Clostridium butyricum]
MQLRSKYFTYPVIIEGGDFYVESRFETDVEQRLDGYNIKLVFKAELINDELEKMLENGTVGIVHHIECPQTCLRETVVTKACTLEYTLKDGQVNGIVQICSFVVALNNIDKYSNSLFSNDYKGFKFDLEKGCIMAIGNQINLRIKKIRDDLANTASIFSIVPNMDSSVTELKINLTDSKIAVILPEKTFGVYSNMSTYLDVQPVMHSMIIIPALMQAFTELKESREQLYTYEDCRWFRSLRKTCSKMGVNLDAEGLASLDIFSISQKLLNTPIVKAVDYLGAGGDDYED